MTSEQEEILIKSGELLKVGIGEYAGLHYVQDENFHPKFRQLVEVAEEESYVYLVSNTVHDFFGKVFDYKLQQFLSAEIEQYNIRLDNYLQLNTVTKIEADECCREWMIRENTRLAALYPEHLKDADVVQTQKETWLTHLSFSLLKVIVWTKFIYFKGNKIDQKFDLSNGFKGNNIFKPAIENTCFEIALKLKQIEILKAKICYTENNNFQQKIQAGAVAMMGIYLGVKLDYFPKIQSFLVKHNLGNIKEQQIAKKYDDFKGSRAAIVQLAKFEKGQIKSNIIKQMKQILPLVETSIRAEIKADLVDIESQ